MNASAAVANLHIVPGHAPEALAELPGIWHAYSSAAAAAVCANCWMRSGRGYNPVATGGERRPKTAGVDLHIRRRPRGGMDGVEHCPGGERLAGQRVMRPYLPVLLLKLEKFE
ncbi:MAG: hypothetical protein U1F42_06605 [Candidatus Competibacteraceae bacterium]